jgi:hypothetical protein
MDGTHVVHYPVTVIQVLSCYDSVENAKRVLGVSAICEPEFLLEKTVGELPFFYEVWAFLI